MSKQITDSIRRINYKDLLLKFFSLCLGTLVWFFVVGTDQMDMNTTIPIEVLNLPKDLVIYNQYEKEVSLTLRGPRSIVQELRNRNLSLPIDLSAVKPDTIVLNTDSLPIPLPSGISILSMQPASITLSIDQLVAKEIPITAVTEGEVAAGYRLDQLTLNPDKIPIAGPQKLISREQSLKTYVINLNDLNHSVTLPVHLDLTPEFMELIGKTTVVAKITVKDKFTEKKVRKIPINIKQTDQTTDQGIKIKPNKVSVVAAIPERLIQETPVLSMLFRASVTVGSGELPRKVPVTVHGVSVPGHESIKILSHSPTEVKVSAAGKMKKNK